MTACSTKSAAGWSRRPIASPYSRFDGGSHERSFFKEYPSPADFVPPALAKLPAGETRRQPVPRLPRKPILPQAVVPNLPRFGDCHLFWSQDVEGSRDSIVNRATPEGITHGSGQIYRIKANSDQLAELSRKLVFARRSPMPTLDGIQDDVWVTERSDRLLLINLGQNTVHKTVLWKGASRELALPPFEVVEFPSSTIKPQKTAAQ
jgi:hypothetical protein